MKTSCKNKALLSALMDNEISGRQEAALRRHLKSCQACREELDALCQADRAVKQINEIAPSTGFNHRFWEKIEAIDAKQEKRKFRHSWILSWRPLVSAGLAAGIAAGLYLGFFDAENDEIKITRDDLFMAENLEMLSDYEMFRHLDLLEDWEAINEIKDRT